MDAAFCKYMLIFQEGSFRSDSTDQMYLGLPHRGAPISRGAHLSKTKKADALCNAPHSNMSQNFKLTIFLQKLDKHLHNSIVLPNVSQMWGTFCQISVRYLTEFDKFLFFFSFFDKFGCQIYKNHWLNIYHVFLFHDVTFTMCC